MNEVQIFNFENSNVRTVELNNEIWFVATDIANALGLTNVSVSLKGLDNDERSKFNLGRQGEANVISEAGLYRFIGTSRKQEAKRFMRWVTHEVLPAIRKTGSYIGDSFFQIQNEQEVRDTQHAKNNRSNAAMINANTRRVRTGLDLVDKTKDPLQRQRLLNEAEHEWMLGARYII